MKKKRQSLFGKTLSLSIIEMRDPEISVIPHFFYKYFPIDTSWVSLILKLADQILVREIVQLEGFLFLLWFRLHFPVILILLDLH